MDIIGYFFVALARVLDIVFSLYFWIILIAALLSWVRPDPYNPVVRFLRAVTDPVFYRVRRWLPFLTIGGIDNKMDSLRPPDCKPKCVPRSQTRLNST